MQLAIYPGSFDPPTYGHLDVVERASALFEKVIVAIGINSSKRPFLDSEVRLAALTESVSHLPNVEVRSFQGLLIDFARQSGAQALVRGLRATSDFDYEFQIAMANRVLEPSIETVFLMTKWEYSFLSSSVVREVALLGGDFSAFVPPPVATALAQHLRSHRPPPG